MTAPLHERKRIFISGKMTGEKFFGFPKFDLAKEAIEALGHIAISPADLDREAGFDAMKLPHTYNWNVTPPGFDMKAALQRDIEALESCDAIFLLNGWESSKGSRDEKAHADRMGIPEFKI